MVEPSEARFPRKLVAALALSSMLTPLNSTMLSVVLPRIGLDLDEETHLLTQALVTSYLITSVVAQAPSGKIGDRFGHRHTLAIGQLAFAIGSVMAAFAPTLAWLAIARIGMAMGGALIVPSAGALLRLVLPPNERGRAFGMFGASMALAAAIGPLVGGAVTHVFGWRGTFLVNLLVLPVAALLARLEPVATRDESGPPRELRFDVVGSTLLAFALGGLVVGSNSEGTRQLVILGGAATAFAIFLGWERMHPDPVVDLTLFARPVFVAGGLITALHNLAMYALLFELPQLVGTVLHVETHRSGPLLVSMLLAMVVVSPVAGRLADRVGARTLAVTGCAIALLGAVVMFQTEIRSQTSLVPSLLLFGVGLGLAASPAQAAAMSASPREASGLASAVLATMRYLGGIAGILVLGALWHESPIREVALAEHHRALSVFSLSLACALGCAMLLPRSAPSATER